MEPTPFDWNLIWSHHAKLVRQTHDSYCTSHTRFVANMTGGGQTIGNRQNIPGKNRMRREVSYSLVTRVPLHSTTKGFRMLLFIAGIVSGLVVTALGIIVAMCLPEPRHSVRPQFFAAVGD